MKFILIIIFLFLSQNISAQQSYRVFINEFLASNVTINADIIDFDDYSDWIELYNDEDFDINIGNYFITDNFNNPTKYQFPPEVIIPSKGFLLLWADGYNDVPGNTYKRDYYPYDYFTTKYFHLNFAVSKASEEIALFNQDTLLVDSVAFNLQESDVSMGRKPDGSSEWFYFGDPTPESGNITSGVKTIEYSHDPVVSTGSGFFTNEQIITINSNSAEDQIKYTLDGSRPTINSQTYNQLIQISETSILKVRVYEKNKLPGRIHTFSYFINESTHLPVVSLSAFPETLWDKEKGIYDNQYKSIEIPVILEYFEPERSNGFSVNAGLRMTGQASLDYPQKSFTISMDDRYGNEVINYQIFPNRKMDNFTELYFRNGGVPDNRLTMFRDGLLQNIVFNKIDMDCQSYIPSAFFINGKYWGIYNIREKIGPAYLSSLYNINPDDIDMVEYNLNSIPEAVEGEKEEFLALINYFEQNDLTDEQNYKYIKSRIDIDEYINYYIAEIYYDNVFWLNQNVRIWKERKEGKKWRWILYDTDNAFGAEGPGISDYKTNTLKLVSSTEPNNVYPQWSTLTFRKLIQNDEFKVKFIQKFSVYLNSIFHPDSVIREINRFKSGLRSEITRHISRWNTGGIINGLPPISNYLEWEQNIEKMRQFAINRPSYQRQHIINNFNLPGTSNISVSTAGQGKVIINDFETFDQENSGIYFKDIPVKLNAIPEVGYRFVKWIGIQNEFENPVSFIADRDSFTITAQFEPVVVNIIPSSINSNTTLLNSKSPYYAQGDITVTPGVTIEIENGVEILMPEESSILVYGNIIIEGTGRNPVKILPNENSKNWGALCIINATDSSVIKNLFFKGATKGIDFTRDKGAISAYNSSLVIDGLAVEEVEAPVFIQYGNAAIKNCTLYTKYAGDLINIKKADFALVEKCILMGNDAFDSDAIDFDGIDSGVIRDNKIFNIYGFNSDAIDLGEDAKNILIENNIIYNITDKGISIGGASNAVIKYNSISNCGQGVGVKDFNSYGYIQNNTFYANQYAIASFEKNIGHGGGNADVVNCIIANSKISSIFLDELSILNISYSISNTDKLKGTNNIFADPMLLNNFRLSSGSPAINNSDPLLPDPDGSIKDIGAYPYDESNQINLLITEIHYDPLEGDDHEFIEFINAGKSALNINGFIVLGDINHSFSYDTISPGEYFILAKNKSIYNGKGYKVFQWDNGILNKDRGNILVENRNGEVIDFINYDCKFWWPDLSQDPGSSQELISPSLENMVSSSWQASSSKGGSPGKPSGTLTVDIYINEFLTSNDKNNPDEHSEFDDWIEFYNGSEIPVSLGGMYITDDLSEPLKYQLPPDSTGLLTIQPKNYLLLWADDQPEQGANHIKFKLDKEGEQIGLVQVVENNILFIDSVTFGEQSANISYGRKPDGSEKWDFINKPTPLDSNGREPENKEELPAVYSLWQNFPNPFNPITTIRYELPEDSKVELIIYNILGERVVELVNAAQKAGKYEVKWYAESFSSGVYIYQIKTNNFISSKKLILLK